MGYYPKLRVATLRLHGVTQIQRLWRWTLQLSDIHTHLTALVYAAVRTSHLPVVLVHAET
ncbi:MAG: hypothetical protein LBM61_03680 [Prevotellaceae bacterium]|nr:hypothetical protein [Prevotellaceae bacterium]